MLTVGRRKKNGCVKSQNSVKHVFVYFILYILIYTVVGSESVDFEGTKIDRPEPRMFWGLRSSLDLRLRITIACSRLNSLGKMRVDLVRSHLDQIQIKSKFELRLQNTSHHPREPVLVPIFSRPLFPPRQVSRSVQSLNWSSPQREGRPKGPLTAR